MARFPGLTRLARGAFPRIAADFVFQGNDIDELIGLQNKIGRDPGERPAREPREAREPRHTPQFLQRSTGAPRTEVQVEEDEFDEE